MDAFPLSKGPFSDSMVVCKMKTKRTYVQTHLKVVLSCFSSNNLPKCSRFKWANNIRNRQSSIGVAPSISVDLKTLKQVIYSRPVTRMPNQEYLVSSEA